MSYIGRGIDSIDNISTLDNLSFNGSDATFNLTQNSVAFNIVSVDALQIQIDGIIQVGNFTQTGGSQITFDFTPNANSVCNSVKHFGVGLLTQPSTGSVGINELSASGTKDATTFLRGDNTFATVSGTTINNNADNRVITGSGTANTLEGEANLTYNGSNLGVNIASPTMIAGTGMHLTSSGSDCRFHISNNTVGDTANDGAYMFMGSDGTLGLLNKENADVRFYTNGSEKMRIKGDGNININKTVNDRDTEGVTIYADHGFAMTKSAGNVLYINRKTSNGSCVEFSKDGTAVGSIHVGASSTTYNTSSDYRLKENEVAISDGITRLKTLKPYRFNWKSENDESGNPTRQVDGFFAHEVSSVVPEAISGEKDAVDINENPIHQGIDQSKLVPLLTSALQEAITKIETLEAKVQALENA